MNMKRYFVPSIVSVAVLAALAGCSSGGSSGSDGGPIKLGAIVVSTGTPYSFAALGVPKMSQYVYDQVNATGGVNGHQIDYTVVDDGNTPAGAAQAARQLILQDGVVALAGGGGFVNCTANAQFFAQQDIYDIEAITSDAACQNSSHISGTETNAYTQQTLMLQFAAENLSLDRQCVLLLGGPYAADDEKASDHYESLTGKKIAFADYNIPTSTSDFTPSLLQAKAARCQSIYIGGGAVQTPAIMQAMIAQNMQDVVLLSTGATYDPTIIPAIKDFGIKIYVPSIFAPFDTANADMDAYRAAAKAAGVQENAFTQGAYLSAMYMVDILKQVNGPITKESVSRAFESMEPITSGLTNDPWSMGKADSHPGAQSIKVLTIAGDEWTLATPTGSL